MRVQRRAIVPDMITDYAAISMRRKSQQHFWLYPSYERCGPNGMPLCRM